VPQSVKPPAISGSPVEGQTLSVVHGTWTNAPASYQDEWGLCANSTEINSCHTVAVGESYSLGASAVGHAIRVRESATNAGGKGELAYSAATALVTALPKSPAVGSGQVAGYEVSVPAVPDARLASTALAASASGTVAIKVSCPAAVGSCSGTVTLRTLNAVSAGHAKKSILTLASGSFTVAGGKAKTVTLHLSGKGRALLSRSHVLRVRATIVAHDPAGTRHTTETVATLRAPKSKPGRR
jgi:hypothetical protein